MTLVHDMWIWSDGILICSGVNQHDQFLVKSSLLLPTVGNVSNESEHVLEYPRLPIMLHPNKHTPTTHQRSPNPPKPTHSLLKHNHAQYRSNKKVTRSVGNGHFGRGGTRRQGAREEGPHDHVAEDVEAQEDCADEEFQHMVFRSFIGRCGGVEEVVDCVG